MSSVAFRFEFCPDFIKPKLSLKLRGPSEKFSAFPKNYVAEAILLN